MQAGRGRERDGDRTWNRLQALSCQHRAPGRAWTQEPRDHDLSRSWMLNRLSHPGAPRESFVKTKATRKLTYKRANLQMFWLGEGVARNAHTSAFLFPQAIFKDPELSCTHCTARSYLDGLCIDPGSAARKCKKPNQHLGILTLNFFSRGPPPLNWTSPGGSYIWSPALLASELGLIFLEKISGSLTILSIPRKARNLLIRNHSTLVGVFAFSTRSKPQVKAGFWARTTHLNHLGKITGCQILTPGIWVWSVWGRGLACF